MRTALDTYMAAHKLNDSDFASLIERDRSLVNKLRSGRAKPSLELAARIEAATAGAVPMSSWVGAAPASRSDTPESAAA